MLVKKQILICSFLCSPKIEVALRSLLAYYGLLACINEDLESLCKRKNLSLGLNVAMMEKKIEQI
jgi:hypothetical protein